MREKHPDADSSHCVYCATKREHPRLSRGENYSCGYKPYRCEICNYATTTKGNLSIHMQSDKHLHNVQEFAASQGADTRTAQPSTGTTCAVDPTSLAAAASFHKRQRAGKSDISLELPKASNSQAKPLSDLTRPDGRKTTVSSTFGTKSLDGPDWSGITSLLNSSSAASVLAQLAASSTSNSNTILPPLLPPLGVSEPSLESVLQQYNMCKDLLNADFQKDASSAATLLQQLASATLPVVNPASQNLVNKGLASTSFSSSITPKLKSNEKKKLFECLLCENFSTDSLLELKSHMEFDRTLNPPIHDFDQRILAVIDNFYYCKLCNYKTPLKANFQVHSKTEKHLQKFQMLLHILEGGAKSEAKLDNFPNITTSVRCVPCDFLAASAHRLDQHSLSVGHELFCRLDADVLKLGPNVDHQFVCRLCNTTGSNDSSFTTKVCFIWYFLC